MRKNILYLFRLFGFIILLMVFMASCQKDFLEKPAGADITLDTIFASSSNAQQLVFLLYEDKFFSPDNLALNWWDDTGYFGWSDVGEDIYTPTWYPYVSYVDGTLSSASFQAYTLDRLFLAVRNANTFLSKASSIKTVSSADAEYVKRMSGEAHAHIAYQYFKGFKNWGSLPWISTPLKGGEEAIPRAPFAAMIDSMVVHLDKAAALLPAKWEDRWTGRFTSVAAKALKAQILVYAASPLYNGPTPSYASGFANKEVLGYGNYDVQRWKKAADACKAAIDAAQAAGHALYTEAGVEKNIYKLAITLTNEHILYQRFKMSNSEGGWAYTYNMMNWPYSIGWYNRPDKHYQPTFQHVDAYQLKNGKFPISGYTGGDGTKPIISQAGIEAGYKDQEYWKNRDTRFHQNVVYHGSKFGENYNTKIINFDSDPSVPDRTNGDWSGTVSAFLPRKFINEDLGQGGNIYYRPIHPIIRLADLYLMYAEALSEFNNGPTAEAIQFLNLVRARSGMPDYDANNYQGASAKDKFHNAIKYERKVEFFMEGCRYFDLRRWKEGADLNLVMTGAVITKGVVSRNNTGWKTTFEDKYYFHPFKSDWVSNTPGLYQNPGY
ncbi:MAG: RagB/SusD family nutrient uptake outer membrane protein [Prolixibacteraceae bacterium]|nr:RagB/SusD family nutrient uptake outer membrane protein [Prolixibacteraceae bacterium]